PGQAGRSGGHSTDSGRGVAGPRVKSAVVVVCETRTQRRLIMNWDQVKGNWKQFTGKVKEKWGKLTDDDLTQIAGKRDQFVGKLQERYGYHKDRAEKEVDEFTRNLDRV